MSFYQDGTNLSKFSHCPPARKMPAAFEGIGISVPGCALKYASPFATDVTRTSSCSCNGS